MPQRQSDKPAVEFVGAWDDSQGSVLVEMQRYPISTDSAGRWKYGTESMFEYGPMHGTGMKIYKKIVTTVGEVKAWETQVQETKALTTDAVKQALRVPDLSVTDVLSEGRTSDHCRRSSLGCDITYGR